MGNYYNKNNTNNNNNNNNRGKPCCNCALVMLLVFGIAILGVMVVHKLREKRIFSIVVDEKDHELLTLQLYLQREQELNKEARNKIEEMKTMVYSLRSQKLDLDRRLLGTESTIASLKDERKVLESTLEEKRNEIKSCAEEKMNSTFVQVAALMDNIKMKESEIQGLKLQLNSTYVGLRKETECECSCGDDVTQLTQEHSTNGTEKTTESYMNVGVSINVDGNQQKNDVDVQSHGVLNVTEGNATDIFHSSGLQFEKTDAGENVTGIRLRKRNFRGQRLRNARSRGVGDGLRSAAALSIEEENGEFINQSQSSNLNQTRNSGSDSVTETKPTETEDINADNTGENVTRLTSDDMDIRHDEDVNRKLLKMQNEDVIEGEGDDSEEDNREPEIDRVDIQRFAESDRDEEDEDEEEAEF